MAKNPSILDESLNRATQSVHGLVLQTAIRGLSGSMTLGELIDEMSQTQFNGIFRGLSIDGFTSLRGAEAKASSGDRFNTRTQAGRDAFDAAVTAFMESQGSAGAEAVRVGLGGGTSAQIRDSMSRLMEQGLVTKSGEKRGTKYTWKKGGKKGK